MTREKIAILGGGVSAMTAAFYLTDQDDWQDKYDITVYQMGWRIGGKGASGRNPDYAQRIEEHGLHIWFGFYDNGFSTIQKAYQLLERPDGAPLQTWQDAFKPHSYIALEEFIENKWQTWPIEFPTNDLVPGQMGDELDIWDLFRTAYMWIKHFLSELRKEATEHRLLEKDDDDDDDSWLEKVASFIKVESLELVDDVKDSIEHLETFLKQLPSKLQDRNLEDHNAVKFLLKRLRRWIISEFNELLDENDEIRRLFISADLGLTILIGMLEDDVFEHGFNVINNYDYKQWLRKNGANEKYTVNSAPVRGFYDLVFAYEQGDFEKPNIEAGTIIRSMMRIALNYKGAIMWKMQAGMGDTIFTPYYQALEARGVKFEYFNKVENITAEQGSVEQILITEQVALKTDITNYDPLVNVPVKGYDLPLACWPDRPNYSQINTEQAELLQQNNINLESFWSNWPQVYQNHFGQALPQKILQKGIDFDKVIFGISVGSLPHLCSDLLAHSPGLKTMSDKIKTVVTQAYQIWGDKTLDELGWEYTPDTGEEPVLSGFVEPFDTWASMDQLIDKETWPVALEPKNIAYFCSAMPISVFPPKEDHQFPVECKLAVKNNAIGNLTNSIYNLWTKVAEPSEFDWSILIDPDNQQGIERFDSQFWRANIDPSEQYVMSVTNSSQYRLATDNTGFDNFYITGDWIQTGLNIGCVEAATMAGMQTSQSICGYPKYISGEKDF
ncbi:NAD(P)-binding protein [Pseudoalteromonas denitrificans]|uniref:NAD(P)-binding Rossmann-like domain-containing protein n=1 Tax=Pseudoalteromonas denitrificans DSM 6059 TaxID=1123010 RepID=A0A1I1RYH6_9GAMM|nr:NAD(P)-binding protein [Pseudoalteromonas denitrificans]SFD37338.1 NAD(P)-binding Rossmann-like domain-containing protein [Pseudoalteromonas denitrificans DSM 6059]